MLFAVAAIVYVGGICFSVRVYENRPAEATLLRCDAG